MTLTGARGLMAVTAVTLPIAVVYATLFLVLPLSEAVLMWGSAPVIGVPLVLLFNTIGLNPIVALAGMSLIWPLGDALPPTAIIGRLTVNIVGYQGPYGSVPEGLRRAGHRHRDPRHADGHLQREAGVADGSVVRDSGLGIGIRDSGSIGIGIGATVAQALCEASDHPWSGSLEAGPPRERACRRLVGDVRVGVETLQR